MRILVTGGAGFIGSHLVDAFIADNSADTYEKVVERLLASPKYGERMALEWLDAARFADTIRIVARVRAAGRLRKRGAARNTVSSLTRSPAISSAIRRYNASGVCREIAAPRSSVSCLTLSP